MNVTDTIRCNTHSIYVDTAPKLYLNFVKSSPCGRENDLRVDFTPRMRSAYFVNISHRTGGQLIKRVTKGYAQPS